MRADELGDARGGRVVGAPFHTLQIGCRVDRLLHVNALRRPCDGVKQHQPLLAELLLHGGLLRLVQLHRGVVAVGEEGQAVDAEQRPFVRIQRQQDLAHLRLPAAYRALDLRRLEQGRVGVHGDLQLAGRCLVDIGNELHDVFGVEVVRRVAGGQIPFGLGLGGGGEGERGSDQSELEAHFSISGSE